METGFEQFVGDAGGDNLSRRIHQRRAHYGGNLTSRLSTMSSREPLGQDSGQEDELARISRQGYSFSNRQSYRAEKEDFLDEFGQ
jgi:hypothetical protein